VTRQMTAASSPASAACPAITRAGECHTAEMIEQHERQHLEHDWKQLDSMELDACTKCGSFEGAATTDCPGERMSHGLSEAVYCGEIDYRGGEWCNQPAIGMSHVYGTTREPYQQDRTEGLREL
jgi:hypothetical protein